MPKSIILVEHQFNRLIQTMIREEINNNPYFNDEITNMIERLPIKIQQLIKKHNSTIRVNPNLKYDGIYNKTTHEIVIKGYFMILLIKECVHLVQDELGILSEKNLFCNEFQEHIIGDLLSYEYGGPTTISGYDTGDKYRNWINVQMNDFNRERFINEFSKFLEEFRTHYKNTHYNVPIPDNYNWHWNEIFDYFGL